MKIEIIDSKELISYPSGSGIEYFDSRIYLVGDDAGNILVTNKRWEKQQEIQLFESNELRIPKKRKADLEASAIIMAGKKAYLLLLGSGSKEPRNKCILYDIADEKKNEFDCAVFYDRLKTAGITDLNIEGAAQVNKQLVLCNRGNKASPGNQFIITSTDFFRQQDDAPIELLKIKIPEQAGPIGISGITYSKMHDIILFTTSMEDINNGNDAGPIGKSYLGIIENADWKIARRKLKVNELLDLPVGDKGFKGFKIESVCIQSEKKRSMKLHLVADNDTGESFLFKAVLRLE